MLTGAHNIPPFCRAVRPTPCRHSASKAYAELATLRTSPAGFVLRAWRHGVGRQSRRRRIVAALGRGSLLWAADKTGGTFLLNPRLVAFAPRYSPRASAH